MFRSLSPEPLFRHWLPLSRCRRARQAALILFGWAERAMSQVTIDNRAAPPVVLSKA